MTGIVVYYSGSGARFGCLTGVRHLSEYAVCTENIYNKLYKHFKEVTFNNCHMIQYL